ncbi:MAG: hypothetical protein JWO76_602, partial [Nocardioides sp.]|nr:hypothetical protein [Nocardioides sp.]
RLDEDDVYAATAAYLTKTRKTS